MPVLMQPGLGIEVLAREAQVDGAQLQSGSSIAEGRALPPPYRDAGLIGPQPRGGQVIGVQVGRGLAAQRAIELGQGLVAEPDVAANQGAVRGGLGEQPAAGIMVEHGGDGALLVGAQAEGTVAVAGDPGLGARLPQLGAV